MRQGRGTASRGRNSGRSKLGAHLFKHKQEAGKVNWKWGDIILMPVPNEGLPLARLNHLSLLKQQHQRGTGHPNACAQMPMGAFLILTVTCHPRMCTPLPCVVTVVLPQHTQLGSTFFFFLIDFLAKGCLCSLGNVETAGL